MPKQLVLKPRGRAGEWHDLFVLQMALGTIAEKLTITKAALWYNIAGYLQYGMEEAELRENLDQEVPITLKNVEARLLWKALRGLRSQDFGRNPLGQPTAPPLGLLNSMLGDVGNQLGFKMPEPEEYEDELDEEDTP